MAIWTTWPLVFTFSCLVRHIFYWYCLALEGLARLPWLRGSPLSHEREPTLGRLLSNSPISTVLIYSYRGQANLHGQKPTAHYAERYLPSPLKLRSYDLFTSNRILSRNFHPFLWRDSNWSRVQGNSTTFAVRRYRHNGNTSTWMQILWNICV